MSDLSMINEERIAKIKVYSDGKAIEENIAVVSAFVSKAINEISCAKIVFAGGNIPVGKFPFSDKDTINPGKTVRIDIECEKNQKTVFEGVVVKKGISVRNTNVLLTDIELTDNNMITVKETAVKQPVVSTVTYGTDLLAFHAGYTDSSGIKGNVQLHGNAEIKPGENIEFKGFGKQFDGSALVSSIRHVVDNGSWITEVEFGLPDKQYAKTLVSRSNLKLGFDDERGMIFMETPGGNKISISDDGIVLDSVKGMKINAKADIKVAGKNIDQSAELTFKAKGLASTEISADGATVIKGAMVMIN